MNFKDVGEFYKSTYSEDGLNRYCIQCCKVNRALESVRKRDRTSKISLRQRHRATQLGVECNDNIKLVEVFKRHGGECAICHRWVPPKQASMDHEFPLSKGGTHTWDNVQLTHLTCNLKKASKVS